MGTHPDVARQRIAALADPDTFQEFGSRAKHNAVAFGMQSRRPAGDGVVVGHAAVRGRPVVVFAQDPTTMGGSLGEMHASKILRILDHAERAGVPVIGLLDSAGARIHEGVASLDGYGRVFRRNVALSGRVPQISVVLGACAGGAVYSPALTDFIVMSPDARMFLTGPTVVKAVTNEDVTSTELGGAGVHERLSGVAHLVAADDHDAIELAAELLGHLPSSCWAELPTTTPLPPDPMPDVPRNHRASYDVRAVIRGVADEGRLLELQDGYAPNIVIGFVRIDGVPAGVVANQPQCRAGVLDIDSSEKAARFVRTCDAFGIPLLALVDTPGFLPGTNQEHSGVIRKGAKLLYAFAEATVPRVTVVLRKAFGGAYIVMNSRALGSDAVFAWRGAELAVMGAEGAVDVVWRRELERDPSRRDELVARYREEAMSSALSAERLSIDEVIEPAETRDIVASTLRTLVAGQPRGFRHDNLPQ